MKFLEKIREKPRGARVMILWISVSVSMIIILSVWIGLLTNSINMKNSAGITAGLNLPSIKEFLKSTFSP